MVDKAANLVAVWDERAVLDAHDRLAHVGVDVGEGLSGPLGTLSGLLLDALTKIVVFEREHAAVGVMNQHDLAGPE